MQYHKMFVHHCNTIQLCFVQYDRDSKLTASAAKAYLERKTHNVCLYWPPHSQDCIIIVAEWDDVDREQKTSSQPLKRSFECTSGSLENYS